MSAPAKRVIVKLGTGILTHPIGEIDMRQMRALARQVATVRRQGTAILLVSSGAIGLGMGQLGLTRRPTHLATLQACAALGQPILMATWQSAFQKHGLKVAQVLLTRENLRVPQRYQALAKTLDKLWDLGIVPVINENDSVSTDEITFGDNDILAALTARLIHADLMVILSTVAGLFDLQGSGKLIPLVKAITPAIESLAQGTVSPTAVGGMRSKIEAAKIATSSGCSVLIGDGRTEDALPRLLINQAPGTVFIPQSTRPGVQ